MNLNKYQIFKTFSGCKIEYALEAASLHPAKVLGIEDKKGTLNFGADADFVMLNKNLDIQSTWIFGNCVFTTWFLIIIFLIINIIFKNITYSNVLFIGN